MARVAIVGSGFIGRAWAISFARAGHDVALWDQEESAAHQAIDFAAAVAPDLAKHDLLGGNDPKIVLARLRPEKTLAAALADADHVQENAFERLDVKKALFADLDRLAAPSAVLASSSSAILPSLFTEHLAHRHRCLVIHPINPPYLIPAAEVVPAPWTSPEIVERARAFLVAAGQAPIVMKRELDGFVMNRMQGALLEEAFRLVADGFATPKTSTSVSAKVLRCAGRLWGRLKRLILMHRQACGITSSVTRAFIRISLSKRNGASIGRDRCLRKSNTSVETSYPRISSVSD